MTTDPKWLDTAIGALATAYERLDADAGTAGQVMARISDDASGERESAAVIRLADYLSHDAAAQQRLRAARDQNEFVAVLVEIGAARQLHFSAATARHLLVSFDAANDGELSDRQLEAVAGGGQNLQNWGEIFAQLPPGTF
jgi:hypothetical protein